MNGQAAWHQLRLLLQASHGHVKVRCLVDAMKGLLQLDSRSARTQDTAVHLRAGCGVVSTWPGQVGQNLAQHWTMTAKLPQPAAACIAMQWSGAFCASLPQ